MRTTFHLTRMNPLTDQFSFSLAAYEMHRHMPGILQTLLRNKTSNPEGIPLEDAFFVVSLNSIPPAITVKTREMVLKQLNAFSQREATCAVTEQMLEAVRKSDGEFIPLHVYALRGGHMASFAAYLLRKNMFKNVEGTVCGPGTTTIPGLTRAPATGGNGKSLPFILDEIDAFVLDARKNFCLPVPHKKSLRNPSSHGPKTIYDYVEQKVAANHQMPGWADFMPVN